MWRRDYLSKLVSFYGDHSFSKKTSVALIYHSIVNEKMITTIFGQQSYRLSSKDFVLVTYEGASRLWEERIGPAWASVPG